MKIEDTYKHLLKFDTSLLQLGEPIQDTRVEDFEKNNGLILPEEFKYLLKKHNGLFLGCGIYGLGEEFMQGSLDKIYDLVRSTFQPFLPKEYIPISPDGAGNYYCLDLTRLKGDTCPVIFYQLNYEYTSVEDVETCHESLAEWIEEVCIKWTLESYDYSGSRKAGLMYKLKKLFK